MTAPSSADREIRIREERPDDHAAIHEVVTSAFGGPAEARLVDALRGERSWRRSLVATAAGEVVGHILFTPVTIDGDAGAGAVGLAPLAVAPGWQRQGVGSRLVAAGLDFCREDRKRAVVVLGHPAYYPRFGFRRASLLGLTCEFPSDDEAFMALVFEPDVVIGPGLVRYMARFSDGLHS